MCVLGVGYQGYLLVQVVVKTSRPTPPHLHHLHAHSPPLTSSSTSPLCPTQALEMLDKKYCQCPYGAAGKRVGYLCPGTCLDWVYVAYRGTLHYALKLLQPPPYHYHTTTILHMLYYATLVD